MTLKRMRCLGKNVACVGVDGKNEQQLPTATTTP